MSGIPQFLLRHIVQVEELTGGGPFGPVYGPAVEVRCMIEDGRRLVRAADGREVISETTVRAPLETTCPAGSRVTLPDSRTAIVILAKRRDGGGLPTPDHLEVALT